MISVSQWLGAQDLVGAAGVAQDLVGAGGGTQVNMVIKGQHERYLWYWSCLLS